MNRILLFNVIALYMVAVSCRGKSKDQLYYSNGKIKSEIIVDRGNAKYIEYYENGHTKSAGVLISQGFRVGKWTYYNEDGTVKAEGNYDEGLKKGIWRYNINDSSYTVDWSIYLNRPLKVNTPGNWILKEHLAPFVPLAGFSDSLSWNASFNIAVLTRNGKNINSVINETIEKSKVHAIVEVLSTDDVEINALKGKEVTQHFLVDKANLIAVQYFLEQGDTVYLVSFFVNENSYNRYKELIKEMAYSFSVI
ncbi:toxin-antitoxin system YwqK family antitoxin [Chitinophaga sp. RAB17]|uniref:toxin-antitoxin system YwqK family antitoxin n=1 Tax=Chitinophaga sp. RAB17 TaxID=3233049 RepID=UPI003F9378C5